GRPPAGSGSGVRPAGRVGVAGGGGDVDGAGQRGVRVLAAAQGHPDGDADAVGGHRNRRAGDVLRDDGRELQDLVDVEGRVGYPEFAREYVAPVVDALDDARVVAALPGQVDPGLDGLLGGVHVGDQVVVDDDAGHVQQF